MKPRHKRLAFIAFGLASAGIACAFVLNAFRANVMFFVSPSEVAARESAPHARFRLGGLVAPGSLTRDADARSVRFIVTDGRASIAVVYAGALPDLFRENAGVVAQGALAANGEFRADQVLAKHDEKYAPPGFASSMNADASPSNFRR